MPCSTPHRPPCRAPYTVYRGAKFIGRVTDLTQLCALLGTLEDLAATQRLAAETARHHALTCGAPWYDLPATVPLSVIDGRGLERPDLRSSGHIRHGFNHGTRAAPCLAEWPWDGDIRPRGMPVPGTGVRGRYVQNYLRQPRTQRDRRLAQPVREDGEPDFRGARRPRALPSCWDDLPRRSWRDRSWKHFRATQWGPR